MSKAELEIEVDGHTYRVGRINTFTQLHIASQWREVLMGLAFAKKNRKPDVSEENYREAVAIIFTGGLGAITAQSREEILARVLSVVKRQNKPGVGWAVITAPDGSLMFDDIRLPQLIDILYAIFDHNGLLDFFSVSPSTSGDQTEEKSGQHSQTEKTG